MKSEMTIPGSISNKTNTAIAAVRARTIPFVLAISGIPVALAMGVVGEDTVHEGEDTVHLVVSLII